jgi:hypothetical protein
MKTLSVAVLFLATIASAHAFAQTKTRAQVYQELIAAQQDGRDFVTDTSYPDVNPIFAHQLEQQQEARLAVFSNSGMSLKQPGIGNAKRVDPL